MTVNSSTLAQFVNQKVVVVRNLPDGKAVEIEGLAVSASAVGILLKPKGKTTAEVIAASEIEEVRFQAVKDKEIKAKTLKVLTFGEVRQHLVDRHGVALSEIRELPEGKALEHHTGLDHKDLGHNHADKSETPRGEAIAAASATSDGPPF